MIGIYVLSQPRQKLLIRRDKWNNPYPTYIRQWISLHLELLKLRNPNEELITNVIPSSNIAFWFLACIRELGIKYNLLIPFRKMGDRWTDEIKEIFKTYLAEANNVTRLVEGTKEYRITLASKIILEEIKNSQKAVLFYFYTPNFAKGKRFVGQMEKTGRVEVYRLELEGKKCKKRRFSKATVKRIRLQRRLSYMMKENLLPK